MIKVAILLSIIYYALLFFYQVLYLRNHQKQLGIMEQSNSYNIIATMDSLTGISESNPPIAEEANETNENIEVPALKIDKEIQEANIDTSNVAKGKKEEKGSEESNCLLKENVKENMEYLYRAQNVHIEQKRVNI